MQDNFEVDDIFIVIVSILVMAVVFAVFNDSHHPQQKESLIPDTEKSRSYDLQAKKEEVRQVIGHARSRIGQRLRSRD